MASNLENPLYSYDSPWKDFKPGVRLQDLREFVDAGVAPAIHNAWSLIVDYELAVPDWLDAPTKAIIAAALPTARANYRSKMMDYYRWRIVKRLRSENVQTKDRRAVLLQIFCSLA